MNTIFLDRKYLLLIAPRLRNFKQKKENLFNFSCCFCGDSAKKTTKARGYVFLHNGMYFFKCFNCSYSVGITGLLKHVDPAIYSQYALEKFSNSQIIRAVPHKIKNTPLMFVDAKTIALELVSALPEGHWVLDYVRQRKLSDTYLSRLYFAPDYRKFLDSFYPKHGKNLPFNDPRIVIPYYNQDHILCGFNARALKSELRYITINLTDDKLIPYGLDRIDINQTVYGVEGEFDSMCIPNALACGNADLIHLDDYVPKENLVLIFDNEYWHPNIRKLIQNAIENGFKVCLFPKEIKAKDLNQMIISGLTSENIKHIIDTHIYSGLRASLELQNR